MISSLFFGAWAPLVIVAIFIVAGLHMMITAKIFGPKLIRDEDRSGLIVGAPLSQTEVASTDEVNFSENTGYFVEGAAHYFCCLPGILAPHLQCFGRAGVNSALPFRACN